MLRNSYDTCPQHPLNTNQQPAIKMVKGILVNRKSDESLKTQLKMEHADLVAEMQTVENLPTHERLQLARLRRAQQLKVARQKEKEWLKLQRAKGNQIPGLLNGTSAGTTHHFRNSKTSNTSQGSGGGGGGLRHISFENSVVLLEAASRNDMQEVAELLEHGITPDAANEDGLTALHQCCIDNNVEMLRLLLEYGANVDAQDSDKWTPLHAAATCGHLELVRILIEHGANLLAVNTDGNMPYDLCDDENTLDFIEAEMSKRGVTQELIDDTRSATERQMLKDLMEVARCGGDLEEPDSQGATPLHIAAANGYVRVVEFLLEMHVNVDAVDKDMWSPVHAAACWGHLEVLEMLAQCGADLNIKNKDDETPSDISDDPEIRERIEQLKTEQESKRLAEAQRRRVRRSQSSNTRAQSVRRTSLRDKTLTTKKDAVEEARLRLQAQEVFIAPDGTATTSNPQNDSNVVPGNGDAMLVDAATNTSRLSNNNNNLNNNHNNNNLIKSGDRKSSYTSQNGHNLPASVALQNGGYGLDAIDATLDTDLYAAAAGAGGAAATTTTHTHSYLPRRPPDGRENDEQLLNNYKLLAGGAASSATSSIILSEQAATGAGIADAVQIQSSKEAANGKINVQVTVLVDTTNNTHHHHHGNATLAYAQQHHQHNLGQQHSSAQLHNQHHAQQLQHSSTPLIEHSLNGATLANLKKQRSLSRNNIFNNFDNSSVLGAATQTPASTTVAQAGAASTTTTVQHHLYQQHQHQLAPQQQLNNNIGQSAAANSSQLAINNNNNNGLLSHNEQLLLNGGSGSIAAMGANTMLNNSMIQVQQPLPGDFNALSNSSTLSGDNMSAFSSVNKFSGVTGDVVSDSTSSKKCCTLM